MAQLNDLVVTGKSRFLNEIQGNISGTASNVTGTVAIAHGGTGATTRLGAAKNLTDETVPTPGFVVGLTDSWGKFGYTSIANLKTTIGSAAAASGGTAITMCTTGEKYTWNAAADTVKQNLVTDNKDYRILLSGSNSAYGETESANKSNRLTFNPYNLILDMNADSNNYVSLSTGTGTSSQLHLYNTGTSLIVLSSGSGTSVKTMGIYANNISNSSTWDGTNTSLVTAVTSAKDTVKQHVNSSSGALDVILSGSASGGGTGTGYVYKSSNLTFNPAYSNATMTSGLLCVNGKSISNVNYSLKMYSNDIVLSGTSSTWDGTNTSLVTALTNKISKETNTSVNWTSSATGRTVVCMLAKIGTIVICTITGSTDANHSITAWTATQLGAGQIPPGYRPSSATEGRIPTQTGGAVITVNTVGTVAITTWSNLSGQMAFGGTLWWKTS